MHFVFFRLTTGTSADNNTISSLQRIFRNVISAETIGIGPFRAVLLGYPLLIFRVEVNPCMGILVIEPDKLTFNRDGTIFKVILSKRVVRVGVPGNHGDSESRKMICFISAPLELGTMSNFVCLTSAFGEMPTAAG